MITVFYLLGLATVHVTPSWEYCSPQGEREQWNGEGIGEGGEEAEGRGGDAGRERRSVGAKGLKEEKREGINNSSEGGRKAGKEKQEDWLRGNDDAVEQCEVQLK